jgi:hypothetical protein
MARAILDRLNDDFYDHNIQFEEYALAYIDNTEWLDELDVTEFRDAASQVRSSNSVLNIFHVAGHFGISRDSGSVTMDTEYRILLDPDSSFRGVNVTPEVADPVDALFCCNVPFFALEQYIRDSVSHPDALSLLPKRIIREFLSKYRYMPDVTVAELKPIGSETSDHEAYQLHVECVFGNSGHLELITLDGTISVQSEGKWISELILTGTSNITTSLSSLSTSGIGKYSIVFERS